MTGNPKKWSPCPCVTYAVVRFRPLASIHPALGSADGDRGRGALGEAAVDSRCAHSRLGSGMSLPGGHTARHPGVRRLLARALRLNAPTCRGAFAEVRYVVVVDDQRPGQHGSKVSQPSNWRLSPRTSSSTLATSSPRP